ncbi:hypothetical protein Cha6605_1488 [Chamaesiphon minutus PCC 6605]|uniref:Uncharacterized protein n=1 Tax=Chamaesiphon minutus (strain ATCC 27169 / PCC 6605) TaxID=1173020 RepID=K9UDC3_CHAP6|nr:hypothetical protein Cha6605_1488 [Chamaesiphon minutus PCC 6605]
MIYPKKAARDNNHIKSVIWPIITNPNCADERITFVHFADRYE